VEESLESLKLFDGGVADKHAGKYSGGMKRRLSVAISFFFIRGNPTLRKAHFVGLDERVKSQLSQVFIKGARPDSNLRPAV
jgi:ABC-type nitrate/sulfonate/bicarbonate transport system ATPase subunit